MVKKMMPGRVPYHNPRDDIDEFGRNKLHYAANNGVLLIVKKLLDEGIDVDAQDYNGWTALHFAAQNNHFKVIQDKQGNGPLWTAAMHANGKYDGIQSLLNAHADPNHKNNHGRSPVYMSNILDPGLEEMFSPFAKKES